MMGRPGQDTVRQEQLRPHREQRIGGGWWAIGGPCTSMACPLVLPEGGLAYQQHPCRPLSSATQTPTHLMEP